MSSGCIWRSPENAIVLCLDEKSQIQALDRTQKMLPMQPGFPERRTHDYVRHGTSTLFAALDIATGKVTAATKPRHRRQEFLAFLKQVARAHPGISRVRKKQPRKGIIMANTPIRNVRVSEKIWRSAMRKANAKGPDANRNHHQGTRSARRILNRTPPRVNGNLAALYSADTNVQGSSRDLERAGLMSMPLSYAAGLLKT